ncbi:gliding motility-associated protein GldE [Tenacibaculum piscium]|uniref:Magnesium/cobalt efflux protein n=1 Tax=Tenacibaculum piscium TaxID=1458515 RepID=A0A2H1YK56_9FLAO|nr:gliding motility-associated protein GldE [Tenacibaculum piscium]MCG8183202.1 gliding motility-associated protein GldE [Tenacibaculum piscium]MCG8204614.1 gliding motility-associated protein GldE [Tenacibaculum piscium]SOS75863.1 Magnesium/cobalt efflux protein [Tenacibaculum piscium]
MDTEPSSLFLVLLNTDVLTTLHCLLLLLLLIGSALVSGTEVAFFSISPTEIDELRTASKEKNTVVKLLDNPKKLLGTILITNNFINILIVLLFATLGEVFFSGLSEGVKFLLEVVFVTFLILLFGEVLPKVYATRKSLQFANFMAKPIQFLNVLLTPFSTPLIKLTSIVENKLGNKNSNFSVERLSEALELTSSGATTKEEQKILEGIVNFGNTETVQIMKPRTDVCAIADDTSYEEVLKMILKHGYSRNPVYHENIDTIIGVLYAKDLLAHLNKKTLNWQKLIRAPFFVPENKKLDDLLNEFKALKMHLAIVVDEYGGTSGIVTLEDVIEEIVGDINDEFDDDDLRYSKLDENNYIFEGKITIKDFCRVLEDDDQEKFEVLKGESETLAGFLLEVFGRVPKKDEKINFSTYTFTIESSDQKRIKQIKTTRNV